MFKRYDLLKRSKIRHLGLGQSQWRSQPDGRTMQILLCLYRQHKESIS